MRNIAVERQRLAGREIIAVAADCDREASFQDLQQLAGAVVVRTSLSCCSPGAVGGFWALSLATTG